MLSEDWQLGSVGVAGKLRHREQASRLGAWVGALDALLYRCVQHARSGSPRAGDAQSVRAVLADMRIRVELCRLLVRQLDLDRARDIRVATLMLAESAAWITARAEAMLADGLPERASRDMVWLAGSEEALRSEIAIHDFAEGPRSRPANSGMSREESAFLNRFTTICRERIAPRAKAADRTGTLPEENWRDLVESGYLCLFHPRSLGGSDAGGPLLAHAMEHLGAACASTLWTATISTALAGKMLHNLCTPGHHERWLRPIVHGRLIGCFAATEHGSGCDPAAMTTAVRRTAHGYRLTGEKTRISNATTADVAVVLARLADALCYVVVDLHKEGVHRATQNKLGLSAMPWGTLSFDEVEIAEDDVIADADMDTVLHTVEWGQLLQACCATGLASAAWEAAMAYAAQRSAFGRPIAHLPLVHSRLAQVSAELDAARLLTHEALRLKRTGRPAREQVMIAKIYATEMSVRAADAAMRTLGGWGYSTDHAVERLYRDSLANIPAGLTTDRLRELLACPMVGVDPWTYEPFPGLEVNPAWAGSF